MRSVLKLALEKIGRDANERAKRAAFAMVSYLAKQTPVDTSRALSNWTISFGTPRKTFIVARYHGFAGSTRWQSIRATEAEAEKILKTKRHGQSIFITNNSPYIQRLNRGWSGQHPGGFIEAAKMIGRKVALQTVQEERRRG